MFYCLGIADPTAIFVSTSQQDTNNSVWKQVILFRLATWEKPTQQREFRDLHNIYNIQQLRILANSMIEKNAIPIE